MQYVGEAIALLVAALWTVAALASEIASRRLGVFVMNVWRMSLALLLSLGLMWAFTGTTGLEYADAGAWSWLLLSGVVGYFFGDWCLFNSYLTIGSRYGQLFMTLAPVFTALSAWLLLGQTMGWKALLAMAVTLAGIIISLPLHRREETRSGAVYAGDRVSLRGVLFGIGAAIGQGLGLVLSKMGLDRYEASLPREVLEQAVYYLPFSANGVRCMAGLACFGMWYLLTRRRLVEKRQTFTDSFSNRTGLKAMTAAVVAGPFLGVGLSLMAVQYAAAGTTSTLMAMTPILILLPSRYLFGQEITARNVVGAVISVIGVSLFFLS
ncbi:MAG: DMT family transporter [Prevotella sp.]|nr:DMT family transporter [Prevotella sp.]